MSIRPPLKCFSNQWTHHWDGIALAEHLKVTDHYYAPATEFKGKSLKKMNKRKNRQSEEALMLLIVFTPIRPHILPLILTRQK